MNQIGETDFAAQARQTAAQVAKGAQVGAKNAADGFNRFVEGQGGNPSSRTGYRSMPLDESKKDFWDSFAEAGSARAGLGSGRGGSAIGTSAVKKAGGGAGGKGGVAGKGDEDGWEKW